MSPCTVAITAARLAVILPVRGTADEIPAYDMRAGCEQFLRVFELAGAELGRRLGECLDADRAARASVETMWAQASPDARRRSLACVDDTVGFVNHLGAPLSSLGPFGIDAQPDEEQPTYPLLETCLADELGSELPD